MHQPLKSAPKRQFNDEELLDIHAVSEYAYCPRSSFYFVNGFENPDDENIFMQRGRSFHTSIDSIGRRYRSGFKEIKALYVRSYKYGIKGKCDLVRAFDDYAIPVEYKSGSLKKSEFHKLQLFLQSICLEEQLNKLIFEGYVYFYQENKFIKYSFSENYRDNVFSLLEEIRIKLQKGELIGFNQIKAPNCGNCSFYNLCMPDL